MSLSRAVREGRQVEALAAVQELGNKSREQELPEEQSERGQLHPRMEGAVSSAGVWREKGSWI